MKRLFLLIVLSTSLNLVRANDSLLTRVYFDFDKYELSSGTKKYLYQLQHQINVKNISSVVVVGHTDQLGTDEYNFTLSNRRAKVIYEYLKGNWKQLREMVFLEMEGMGKSQLVTQDSSEEARSMNRRVEVYVRFNNYYIEYVKPKTKTVLELALTNPNLNINDRILLNNVNFDRGKHALLPEAIDVLDNLADILIRYPNINIKIEGHVCCTMNDDDDYDKETNQKNLSLMRAYTVYNYLISKGVAAYRLNYIGFGHKYPMADEFTLQGQDTNRRVEIRITDK